MRRYTSNGYVTALGVSPPAVVNGTYLDAAIAARGTAGLAGCHPDVGVRGGAWAAIAALGTAGLAGCQPHVGIRGGADARRMLLATLAAAAHCRRKKNRTRGDYLE